MLAYFVPFFIGLIVSYALTPAVKKLAVRVGAVDRPEARKVHTHIIPRSYSRGLRRTDRMGNQSVRNHFNHSRMVGRTGYDFLDCRIYQYGKSY